MIGIQVASLYAKVGVDVAAASAGLREVRSRLVQLQSNLKGLGDQSTRIGITMSASLTAPLTAAGVNALKTLMSYEQAMNQWQFVTKATGDQAALAGKAVEELAADMTLPGVSAADAANALFALAKGGMSAQQSIDALRGALALKVASDLSAAESGTVVSDTLNAFKLPATEATRIADLLAGAEMRASGSIRDHADAMKMASAVWHMGKQPVEDLVTAIALMANAGIKGQDAGTSLKTMMLQLMNPTEEAAAWMRVLGISVWDAQGKMRPFPEIVAQFERGLAGLTDQQKSQRLATIFGNDAIRAAEIVLAGGSEAFDKMKGAVTEAGAAQEMAEAKAKGLSGAVEGLGSQVETAGIKALQPWQKDLEGAARGMAALVGRIYEADPALLKAGIAFLAVVAIVGPLLLLFAAVAAVLGGPVALAVAGTVLVLAGLAAGFVYLQERGVDFGRAIKSVLQGAASWFQWLWGIVKPIFDGIQWGLGLLGLVPSSLPQPVAVPMPVEDPYANVPSQWRRGGGNGVTVGGVDGFRAGGGGVAGGRSYVIGEEGPELFVPSTNGAVVPNGALGGGGGDTHHNYYGPVYGFSDFEDMVVRATESAQRRGRL